MKSPQATRIAGRIAVVLLLLACAAAAPQPPETGPDVVTLDSLKDQYEAVPFDHRAHAKMAQMWDGCLTCHHRNPTASTRPGAAPRPPPRVTQDAAAATPTCRSCHPPVAKQADFGMPNLQGAYHRQCLNCHREWMGDKDCEICHKLVKGGARAASKPTPDDIVGRIHPPIPEPGVKTYRTRFTPAVGVNVVFRHDEHTRNFGLRCVDCHRKDTCRNCHATGSARPVNASPMKPGRTWRESHEPCGGCHQKERCGHCHYKDGQPVPPAFDHRATGQTLDKDHAGLKCLQCHVTLRSNQRMTCGGAPCHQSNPAIAYPRQRPGLFATTRPWHPPEPLEPRKGVMR